MFKEEYANFVRYLQNLSRWTRRVGKVISEKFELEKPVDNLTDIEKAIDNYDIKKKDLEHDLEFILEKDLQNTKIKMDEICYALSENEEGVFYISIKNFIFRRDNKEIKLIYNFGKDTVNDLFCFKNDLYIYNGSTSLLVFDLETNTVKKKISIDTYIIRRSCICYNEVLNKILLTGRDVDKGTSLVEINPETYEKEVTYIDSTVSDLYFFQKSKIALIVDDSRAGTDTHLLAYNIEKKEKIKIKNLNSKSTRISFPKTVSAFTRIKVNDNRYVFSFMHYQDIDNRDKSPVIKDIRLTESEIEIRDLPTYDFIYKGVNNLVTRERLNLRRLSLNSFYGYYSEIIKIPVQIGNKKMVDSFVLGDRAYSVNGEDYYSGRLYPNATYKDYLNQVIRDKDGNPLMLYKIVFLPTYNDYCLMLQPIRKNVEYDTVNGYSPIID